MQEKVRSVEELKEFLLRGTEDVKKGKGFQTLWPVIYSFLMFILVRTIVLSLMLNLYFLIAGRIPGLPLLLYDQERKVAGFTGNGSAIAQLLLL